MGGLLGCEQEGFGKSRVTQTSALVILPGRLEGVRLLGFLPLPQILHWPEQNKCYSHTKDHLLIHTKSPKKHPSSAVWLHNKVGEIEAGDKDQL